MDSDEIRSRFVRFFQTRDHLLVLSASLVPHGDPSVLFTTAGMQQFKPYYTQPHLAPAPRVVTVQRCLRTDDIDEVGDDTHHSFFEMLGNFSFGDYFKREAIAYAHELVTREYGLPPDRIWGTFFAGEPGLPRDEAAEQYLREVGIPPAHIRAYGRQATWWGPTGDEGPCGPTAELHVDRGRAAGCGLPDDQCHPEHGCGRFVEIWNLVFNQYHSSVPQQAIWADPQGALRPLEKPGIDTGAGFERVVAILQGIPSAYESDLFAPIFAAAADALGVGYRGGTGPHDRSLRVIADHARAVTFLLADGIFPAQEGRGYVLRRILRRAVWHARLLGHRGQFIGRLAAAVIDRMVLHYPYLETKRGLITHHASEEEARFAQTLDAGLALLGAELDRLQETRGQVLSGEVAFRLHDTFGFPLPLTQEVAAARGIPVDLEGYQRALEEARARSRAAARFLQLEVPDLPPVSVEFVGYTTTALDGARVLYLRQGETHVPAAEAGDEPVMVVLDRTPFYAERGGQVGDRGWIVGPEGRMWVETTQTPVGNVIVHLGRVEEGRLREGELVRAEVIESDRRATARNHTATHLLHAALRQVLGPHAQQAGSLVAPDRLRFDFSQGRPLTAAQRAQVQAIVNQKIRENLPVETAVLPLEQALASGAIALFDEKYGEQARVVSVPEFSHELCGGTHVARTGDIGLFVLTSEGSIGAGLRRIEALTGAAAEAYVTSMESLLAQTAAALEVQRPEEAPERAAQLRREVEELRRRVESLERREAQRGLERLLEGAVDAAGIQVLAAEVPGEVAPSATRLREVGDWLRDKLRRPAVLILAAVQDERPAYVVMAAREAQARGLNAGAILRQVLQVTGGRGGGSPLLAQGGGGDPQQVPAGLAHARAFTLSHLRGEQVQSPAAG